MLEYLHTIFVYAPQKTVNFQTSYRLGICQAQTRNYGVAWGGKFHPFATGCHLCATPENFLAIFYCSFCCFIFVAKERSPKILVEINLGLCTRKFCFFLCTLYTFGCDNIKYEISSHTLYHMIPPVKICHP